MIVIGWAQLGTIKFKLSPAPARPMGADCLATWTISSL